MIYYIIFGILATIFFGFLALLLVCFFVVFYSKTRKPLGENEYNIPRGEIYKPYEAEMIGWVNEMRSLPHEDVQITSHDGLTLRGKYYEYSKDAPIEILFHGYRGDMEHDLSGSVHRCFTLGRSALVVDQRASGKSDGHVITFGIKERHDCVGWVNYAVERFGKDCKIIITGISMGAATVMTALNEKLPKNVVCVLADCGYSSPREIIRKVLRDLHIPVRLFYPAVRLSARIFGGFKLEECSAMSGVEKSDIPIIFIHGEADGFVPFSMSRELYRRAKAKHKKLVAVPGVGHGLAFPADREGYYKAIREFESEIGMAKTE